ncbi:Aspartyl/glutamyl-tRNA(Asn/Gln) amidotransferase subunit B [Frankliniella fusca]|uniref:Aspartyl/glutamyl-tRNA(Asn/Gln) amidotransferase subunit B n=1 Tax=Frankliniella fusca TaxID=407009 RepID=A0AAE1GYL5_9NEOP|nr:Aspartyl/glutamyl-tRNA(Asn/Gln) amidotransferase subunit B [Frankliniella fusca]
MIMSQASNVRSLQTFGKCRLRDRTLWNKAMIFPSFFTSSGKEGEFLFALWEEAVYFTLNILCFPPYTVGKARTSMSSSKVRDKGMLPHQVQFLYQNLPQSRWLTMFPVDRSGHLLHLPVELGFLHC